MFRQGLAPDVSVQVTPYAAMNSHIDVLCSLLGVTEASQSGGVCPATGPNTHACCQQDPVDSTKLRYQVDGRVYCYGGAF